MAARKRPTNRKTDAASREALERVRASYREPEHTPEERKAWNDGVMAALRAQREGKLHKNPRNIMDKGTREHLSRWLAEHYRGKERTRVRAGLVALVKEYPELLVTHTWTEMVRMLDLPNPSLMVLGNPPIKLSKAARRAAESGGSVFMREVLEIRYIHQDDGKAYVHEFQKGTKGVALADGSVRLVNPKVPIWGEY